MRKHAKHLKGITAKINVELTGEIGDWVDVKTLTPIREKPEEDAESSMLKGIPHYQEAKEAGERFAREITD